MKRGSDHGRAKLRNRPQPCGWVDAIEGVVGAASALARGREGVADVDEVVGDHAQADPALDAGHALVTAAVQAMATFEETDATLTSGAPFLGVAEPAFLLESLSFSTPFGRAVGDGDSLDALSLGGASIALREEGGISGEQMRHATQELPMYLKGGKQQIAVPGALWVDFVVRDDLRFGLLDLDHFAELGGLGGLSLADHLRVRLEEADELAGDVCVALEDALTRLMHHLTHQGNHLLEVGSIGFQADLLEQTTGALAPRGDFFGEPFGLPDHARGMVEELAVADFQPLLALRHATAARAGNLPDL